MLIVLNFEFEFEIVYWFKAGTFSKQFRKIFPYDLQKTMIQPMKGQFEHQKAWKYTENWEKWNFEIL